MEEGDVRCDGEKSEARAQFRRVAVELGLPEAGKQWTRCRSDIAFEWPSYAPP